MEKDMRSSYQEAMREIAQVTEDVCAASVYSPQKNDYCQVIVNIGKRLGDARRNAGLLIDHISELSGMSRSTVSRVERGLCDRYSAIAAYCDTLFALTGHRVSIVDNSGRNW